MVGPIWRAVVCRVIGDSRQGNHIAVKLKFDELPTTVESEIVGRSSSTSCWQPHPPGWHCGTIVL